MNPRSTGFWMVVVAVLAGLIFLSHRFGRTPSSGPTQLLPHLHPTNVTTVQVRPAGQIEIRAVRRADKGWELVEPITYPAQTLKIQALLETAAKLVPAAQISGLELRSRTNAEAEYGLSQPQAYLVFRQGNEESRLIIGALTSPGDQVFVQKVGTEGAFVVDAELLKYIPTTANAWRDTSLVRLKDLSIDRLGVTNKGKVFELGRKDSWRLTFPIPSRADPARVSQGLEHLEKLQVLRFVSDDPKADLEPFGLVNPELSIALYQGTNRVALLSFGRSPTNTAGEIFAKRSGSPTVVTVSKELVSIWQDPVNSFRDPLLFGPVQTAGRIDITGSENFSLELQTNSTWQVLPGNFSGDSGLVKILLMRLSDLRIQDFVQDVVTPPDLPAYGLVQPQSRWVLSERSGSTGTNSLLADVSFGTNAPDRVFARRSDENSVFAVAQADYQRLPSHGWELRDRKIWSWEIDQVSGIELKRHGRTQKLLREAAHQWKLAPGSQGIINELAVEETVRGLSTLSAHVWAGVGESSKAAFGFTDDKLRLTVEFKNGPAVTVQFGGEAASTLPFAAVQLGGETWIFEFPWPLYRDIQAYLPLPPPPP